jgi:hypothetical protein
MHFNNNININLYIYSYNFMHFNNNINIIYNKLNQKQLLMFKVCVSGGGKFICLLFTSTTYFLLIKKLIFSLNYDRSIELCNLQLVHHLVRYSFQFSLIREVVHLQIRNIPSICKVDISVDYTVLNR